VAYLPSSKTLEKRGRTKREAWTWLRLDGVSFTILPFEERDSVLRDYAGLLSSVKRGALLARRIEYEYKYSDYSFSVSDTAFYLKAPAGSQVVYFNPRPEEPSRPRVKRLVNPATLELEDGSYARVLVAYGFPAGLPEGLLYTLYTEVSEAALVFREVDKVKAVRMVETARRRRITSGSQGVTEAHEAGALEELASRVLSGSSLFEFYLYFIVRDRDPKALNARSNTVKSLLKGYGVDVDAPPIQRELYNLETCLGVLCIEKHYADSESLKSLFPLISEELHDEGGVFLGVSGTGSPVLLDVWSKPNLNFVIVGVTGSGKSMTAKVYLKRLRELDKKILYVGVNPESEYTRVAGLIGAQAVEIYENQRLGLDPIRLLRSGALELGQVADVVSEVYGVPERLQGVLRRELFMNADFVDTFAELAATVRDPELSKYLQGATVPPDSYVYEGEPPPLAGSVILGLKNVRSKRLKILISALISAYAYNTLLSKARKSVFFVDEAWLFMETPSIVGLFENLARRGRKHGVAFLYITQRAEDLAKRLAIFLLTSSPLSNKRAVESMKHHVPA
jgi:type IV secretion system protein VirB4